MKALLVPLVAALAMASASPAAADFRRYRDPNDTIGILDIRWASHGHHVGMLEHQIVTYEGWSVRRDFVGSIHILINLTSDDPDFQETDTTRDAEIYVYKYANRLAGKMYVEAQNADGYVIPGHDAGPVIVKHPAPNRVVVRFAPELLPHPGPYQWLVSTQYPRGSDTCSGGICFDEAAGKRYEMHGVHPQP